MGSFEELFALASKQEDYHTHYEVYMESAKEQHYNLTIAVDADADTIYRQLDEVLPKSDNVIRKLACFLPGMPCGEVPSCAFREALERHNPLNGQALVAVPGVIERILEDTLPQRRNENE